MPEAVGACPELARLIEFHECRLAEGDERLIAQHTEACASCRAELKRLATDNDFSRELRDLFPGGLGGGVPESPGEHEREALAEILRESAEGERYEILGELGRGGMGIVFEVRDRVLQRNLAMKVAGSGERDATSAASPSGRRLTRFLEEVRITGQLDHPSIIPVHELGIDGQGRAFFTMTKVRGQDLREVFEEYERGEGDWTLRQLVGIVARAGDAIAYAHTKHVVHRDLKPANIMVGRFSAVYVMDWGVAKVLVRDKNDSREAKEAPDQVRGQPSSAHGQEIQWDEPDSPQITLEGEVLGTPAYMAPEQALGKTDRVQLSSDVYSMGAILYRLLSGRTPYHDHVKGDTPPRTAWKRLLEGPPAPLHEIAPKAPSELVAVSERAMSRQPEARYADMGELIADLRAWLEGRVVRAHKTGVVVELRKWIARNRALTALALLALLVVPGLFGRHLVLEARSRDKVARVATELADQRLKVARGATALAAVSLLDDKPTEALRLAIQVVEAEPDYLSRTTLLAALQPLAQEAFFSRDGRLSTIWSNEGSRRAWSPSGDAFVCLANDSASDPLTIRVWNVRERGFDEVVFDYPKTELCIFHPDGRRIASGGADGSLAIHDLETGESRSFKDGNGVAHTDVVARLAFGPDGKLLASASWDGSVRLWNTDTGRLERSLDGHTRVVTAIEFDLAGERLLSASGPPTSEKYRSDGTARVWDVADGTCLLVFGGHEEGVTSARFHPTRDLVLSTSYDDSAQLWDSHSGEVRATMRFLGAALDGAFSPDGSTLAVAYDSGFRLRDIESGHEEVFNEYEAHDGRSVWDVEFSPDGDRLLTTGMDGVGRVWNLDEDSRPQLALRLEGLGMPAFGSWSPDGSRIATFGLGDVRVWFPNANPTTDWVQPTGRAATRARFHPTGDRVLLSFKRSPAYEYAFAPGTGLQSPPTILGDAPASDVAASSSGIWTLVAEADGPVHLWRRDGNGLIRKEGVLQLQANALHPSTTRDLVGVILADGGAAVIDCSGEPKVTALFLEGETVNTIQFSEDGERAALGTTGGHLLVVDLAANGRVLIDERLDSQSPKQTTVFDSSFYDSGRHLVSVGPQGGVKVWDVDAGRELLHLFHGVYPPLGGVFVLREGHQVLGHAKWGIHLFLSGLRIGTEGYRRLSPDLGNHRNRITMWSLDERQRRLLTISLDHKATIWNLEHDGEPWVTFAGHKVPVLAGDLSRDGAWAVTADASGRVFVWPTDPLEWAKKALPADARPGPR